MDYDPVTLPEHYIQGKTIQPIDVIEDWNLPFHLAQVVKYVARYREKHPDDPLADLRKAQWYLARYISRLEQ